MSRLGKNNRLRVIRQVDFGYFLDGEQHDDILLPRKLAPPALAIGDEVDVFIYNDSEDRIIATTQTPRVRVGECAYLKAVSVNRVGAFMDWGLSKDLLVPYSEQQKPMQKGFSYTVYVFVDESTQRIAASTRLEDHLSIDVSQFRARQPVDLMIYGKSDLGYKAVINGSHCGQLFDNELFRHLHYGESIAGYIKRVRADGKIDLMLQLPSEFSRDQLCESIVAHLHKHQGISSLTDKSPAEAIYAEFGVSKASFKKALGQLYKNRLIKIEKHQVTLL